MSIHMHAFYINCRVYIEKIEISYECPELGRIPVYNISVISTDALVTNATQYIVYGLVTLSRIGRVTPSVGM
jgi:hypothetical protein